tara:strand:- start:82 stop:687 length:606 start_codon:yes stop_codon:yes gene_type:complete
MLSFTPDLIFYIVKLCEKNKLSNLLNIKYFYNILTSDSIELCKLLLSYNGIYISNNILLKYINLEEYNNYDLYYNLYRISIKPILLNNSFEYQQRLDNIINNIILNAYSISNNKTKYTSIEYIPLVDFRDEICEYHDSMNDKIDELMETIENNYDFYFEIDVIINIFEDNLINVKKINYQYWNGNGGPNYEYYILKDICLY